MLCLILLNFYDLDGLININTNPDYILNSVYKGLKRFYYSMRNVSSLWVLFNSLLLYAFEAAVFLFWLCSRSFSNFLPS